jgi:hypothetical protein
LDALGFLLHVCCPRNTVTNIPYISSGKERRSSQLSSEERGLESPHRESLIKKRMIISSGLKSGAHVNNRINYSISEGKKESPKFS